MILAHFNIATELQTNNMSTTSGLGHAIRCLNLLSQLKEDYLVCINKSYISKNFIISKKIKYIFEEDLNNFLKCNKVSLIISDINYLKQNFINIYKRFNLTVVCLAGRGSFKNKAHLAFQDVFFEIKKDIYNINNKSKIFRGPRFAIIRKSIINEKKNINIKYIKHNKNIIVSMGGVDAFDMTLKVIKSLKNLSQDYFISIIIGKFYKNKKNLLNQCKLLSCKFKIYQDPKNFHTLLKKNTFGICGTGIVTYEAMSLGILTINIGHSSYHSYKGIEIQNSKVGYYLGDVRYNKKFTKLPELIENLYQDEKKTNKIRKRAYKYIDGKGLTRISKIIKKYLKNNE